MLILFVMCVNAALLLEREVIMNVSFRVLSSATKAPSFHLEKTNLAGRIKRGKLKR